MPEIVPAPSRFRNPIGKYTIRRNMRCTSCGLCARLCPYGVHPRYDNYSRPIRPKDHRCIGFACQQNDFYCIARCPEKALTLRINPILETLGDYRWPAEMLIGHWHMAETGNLPVIDLEYDLGNSGGGFDKIRFRLPDPEAYLNLPDEQMDTSVDLNKRGDGRIEKTIFIPCYGGGMSFGSTALPVIVGRARAARRLNTLTCTGEGGYPLELVPYAEHVITQIATGLFGVREETILFAPVVEFKYAQGAKPGLGGHLLGDKVTPKVAAMRETVVGNALFSPFPFHSVYSVEDHKKHIDWVKAINPRALVSVKVSTPTDVDMVAVGSYYAGAHIVHLDGSYGGTGAAPDIAKKNIAMPIEYAIPKVHQFLQSEGVRDKICLIASGGIRSAMDVAKAIALGADGVVIGTAELVALECVRCGNCESGRGCARGIATTDSELGYMTSEQWTEHRIVNMYTAWRKQWCQTLRQCGLRSFRELVGRTDLLVHLDYLEEDERKKYVPAPNYKMVI
ncbi:MAG: alpha-hydroxy-acid oxidizing protein [Desulfobacterales bacterium]|uniref:glutamate synthase (NADPH) n=1 Tax=Candidatus Desulfatibia profunda TaxID=2841695 RepID=A0A8J6TG73_9BACT|nr:alpha-hydroxy-acid oxidizing protein [Candidatus Desulfatibia profunda]MBL7179140.1 alpha-hydroxy-acid oxidizing protein [Desulfobacterales bacterium]